MTRNALLDLAGAAAFLTEKIRALQETHETSSVLEDDSQRTVEAGIVLWTIIDQAEMALKPLKQTLRDQAVQETKGVPGNVTLVGTDPTHQCTVVIPKSAFRVSPGSIDTIRSAFGEVLFHDLFQEIVTYRTKPDFEEQFAHLQSDPRRAQILSAAIVVEDRTPRVTFKVGSPPINQPR